jgi:predicted RNase H-like HicB family nuclease
MKHLQRSVKAVIYEGEDSGYVGSCYDLPVVTQGSSLDEVVKNLKEAVSLHLDGEDLSALGYIANPGIIITYELDPVHAQA